MDNNITHDPNAFDDVAPKATAIMNGTTKSPDTFTMTTDAQKGFPDSYSEIEDLQSLLGDKIKAQIEFELTEMNRELKSVEMRKARLRNLGFKTAAQEVFESHVAKSDTPPVDGEQIQSQVRAAMGLPLNATEIGTVTPAKSKRGRRKGGKNKTKSVKTLPAGAVPNEKIADGRGSKKEEDCFCKLCQVKGHSGRKHRFQGNKTKAFTKPQLEKLAKTGKAN